MPKRLPTLHVALLALAFTYLFFSEYLSPLRKIYIPFDLWGYHYPLMDAAFQRLQHFSFPAWDPSIYCGQPFAANIQAALFYPPSWILYAVSAIHGHLTYTALEAFVFAHIWLAFMLFFCWLRSKGLTDLACILGAGVFAYSGFAMLQLQHLGLICGYAWLPLGLWGIDDRSRRGFLKIITASAACFLAGYPPMWTTLAIFLIGYAVFARRLPTTILALSASLVFAAVQLLPTIEASSRMLKENNYGGGIRDLAFYASYLVPNLDNFGIDVPAMTNPGREYLYLGAPAFFGIAALIAYKQWRPAIPILAAGAICLVFLTNPFQLVSSVLGHFEFLAQIFRDWYFLAAITAAVAGVAAIGLDRFLTSETRTFPSWPLVLALPWAIYELLATAPSGGWSALAAVGTLAIFTLCIFAVRSRPGLAVVLLLCAAVDYKVNGTGKRFNGRRGALPHDYAREGFWGMDPQALKQLKANPEDRILLDFAAPMPVELRHHGLSTPQGFDPFVSQQYLNLAKDLGAQFQTNREFTFDPANDQALAALGVRYIVTTANAPFFAPMKASKKFMPVGSEKTYFRVFELQNFQPTPILFRTPEIRRFRVNEDFVFKEQFFPGWTATLDGQPVSIEKWRGAFQGVHVPPGDHVLEFRYQSKMLRLGAWISLISLILLLVASLPMAFRRDRSPESPPAPSRKSAAAPTAPPEP
jgi:hypothetical protein